MKNNPSPKLHKRLGRHLSQKHKSWAMAIAVVLIAGGGALLNQAVHAAANTLYVAPSGGTYNIGDTVTIAIRENSGTTGVYSAQAGLSYPQSLLRFVSIDGNGSAFGVDTGLGTGGNGHVEVIRGSTTPVTNDQLVANVTFSVVASGSATVSFDAPCQGNNTTNCSAVYDVNITNVISSVVGGTYTIATPPPPTCPAGQVGTPPNCTTPPPPTPPPSPPPPPPSSTTKNVAITPDKSLTPIVAPNGSQIQVSTPANVQPASIQPDGVEKVQYFLNNKLVFTANAVPYTYHLDTTHLLNGVYTLKSIKFYISGRQDTSTQRLVIKNPFSLIQFGLLLRHYIVEIIIPFVLIVLAGALVYIRFHRIRWPKGPGTSSIDTPPSSPTMNVQGPTIVTPNTGAAA